MTNLLGENAFGDFDFSLSKHRNASLFHHSTLHMTKANDLPQWINKKSNEDMQSLMESARKHSKQMRRVQRQREQAVIKAVWLQMLKNAADQQEKERQLADTKRSMIEA